MYTPLDYQLEAKMKKVVDRIIFSAKLSPEDYNRLMSTLADGKISEGERRQINRVFDCIQTRQLKLIDW